MKTSLKHLPKNKQKELQRAVDITREEVDFEMLILFGSYARGDWVEDLDEETLLYNYDILVVTATECFYGTILLVFTRYKPSTHDLVKLAQRVASVKTQFLTVFPQGTEEEKNQFDLLRKAYVNARYKPSYVITKQELECLAERVQYLQELTEKLCKEKIVSFE